jgi:hypothetical protein
MCRYVMLVRRGKRKVLCFLAETHSPLLLRVHLSKLDRRGTAWCQTLGEKAHASPRLKAVGRILRNDAFQ